MTLGGVFILGQFGRFELGSGRALYFQDIVLALFGVFFIYDRGVKRMYSSTLGKIFVALNIWILLTTFFNFSQDRSQLITVALYLIRFDMVVLFATALHDVVTRKILASREVTLWLIGVPTAIALIGFLQYFFYPDTRGLQLLGWDDHYYRLISTIFDPGFTGILLVLGSFIVMKAWVQKKSLLLTLCYILLTAALLLTYSRASYLAFLVGVVFIAWKLRKYVLLMLIPIFLGAMFLLPRPGGEGVKLERTASVIARVDSVNSSLTGFSARDAILGKGWYWKKVIAPTSILQNTIVPNHSSATENSYIFVLSSLGIVGVLLCSAILISLCRSRLDDPTALVSFLVVSVHALFTNTFFYSFVLILLAVIMARSEPQCLEKSQPRRR